ncbi:MAG: ATP-dependent helicase, partial [Flavobacteriales bacterium]
MDFLNDLNEAQRQAAEHIEGASIIIAGAGSGKTRVLTYKIAYLLTKGINPFEILALTFTNKAAKEMKKRIADMVSETEARKLWMGTFHSIFARILRIEADTIGFTSNFTIYDTEDSRRLIKNIVKEMGLDEKIYKPGVVHNRISLAKNNLVGPEEYNADDLRLNEDKEARVPMLCHIYSAYQMRLFKAAAMDFDDLLFNTYKLLSKNLKALHKYQGKFRHILVDEFQDTNHCQYLILKKLGARYRNICVVGDDAQSIYAFRGAHIRNMLDFQKDFPETAVFKLEQNYRSTKNIVAAANCVIEKNKQQLHKKVWTDNGEGEKIQVLKTLTDNEEAYAITNSIFEIRNNSRVRNRDFAVLYRTNAQSRAIEDALRRSNIPYRVYGGLSFYQRREVK